jgi:hypothetical protein
MEEGPNYLTNPAANLDFRSLISDEETRQIVVITENSQASFQINFGALSKFETGPHLVSPNDVENYNSEIEQTYLDKARQYVLLDRVSITNLVAIQRQVYGELEKIYSGRQSKIYKKVLTELAEKNYAKMAADLIRNAFAEMSDERGDIAFHIILTLRTLKRVAFLRVIKKDYPSRDEYYRLLLNFPLIAEELRFIQNPSVENIPNPRNVEPLFELNEI